MRAMDREGGKEVFPVLRTQRPLMVVLAELDLLETVILWCSTLSVRVTQAMEASAHRAQAEEPTPRVVVCPDLHTFTLGQAAEEVVQPRRPMEEAAAGRPVAAVQILLVAASGTCRVQMGEMGLRTRYLRAEREEAAAVVVAPRGRGGNGGAGVGGFVEVIGPLR